MILLTSGKNLFALGAGGAGVGVVVARLGDVNRTVARVFGAVFGFAFVGFLLHKTLSGQSQNLLASFHFRGGAQVNLKDKPSAQMKYSSQLVGLPK